MRLWLCFLLIASTAVAGESDFLARTRQLTFEGRRSGEGYFSPDGSKIVFQSEREGGNPFYQIYALDLSSGETRRVSPGTGKTTCSFFQAGTGDILFASTHLDPDSERLQKEELEMRASGKERRYSWDYDPHYDIFVAPADGGDLRRLTTAAGYDAEGAFSPDGKQIVFCSTRSAYPLEHLSAEDRKMADLNASFFGEIYIMNADGSDQRRLTDAPGYDGGPFFSPNGRRIVWRHFNTEGTLAEIFTMAIDGSDKRQITDFGCMSWAPYYHPSGDYLIFSSNKYGFENFELFIVDAAGKKEPVRVTETAGFDGLPVFSPDGANLLWSSTRYAPDAGRRGGQLYMARWNDAAARAALEAAPARIHSTEADSPASQPASQSAESPAAPSAPLPAATAPVAPEITEGELKDIVTTLASDAMEGRLTGTAGERMAGDFIEKRFQEIGLRPMPGMSSYRQEFTFTAGVNPGPDSAMKIATIEANPHVPVGERLAAASATAGLKAQTDFMPLSISDEGTTSGLIAFAGYGLVVPNGAQSPTYDSYGDLDVQGRIVVILRYVPEGVSADVRQNYNRYAGLRYKALQARERGAAGLLVVTGPNSPGSGDLVPLSLDFGGVSSGILAASITVDTAEKLLAGSGQTLKQLQAALDDGAKTGGFTLEDRHVELTVDLEKETRTGANIVGYLPGKAFPSEKPDDTGQYVVIGAHYDHLGKGQSGTSLAHKGEENEIHHGADDNASGVAALIEIAGQIAGDKTPPARNMVFTAWSGEEVGLLGSAHFCDAPPLDLPRVAAYLNMDMVGRVRNNQLAVQGVGSSSLWKGLLEKKNLQAGFSLALSDDPYLPTDSTSFYLKKVPVLAFFSGAHEDYHRPTDTADKINYPDLARVAGFVESIALTLADEDARPDYVAVQRTRSAGGGDRDTLRTYLGTIPDYTTENVRGVKLSGVRAGGPADKAGLRGGDIIKRFAGQEITNIYDYTYALDAAKIGEPIEVIVERDGQLVTLHVTPEARE